MSAVRCEWPFCEENATNEVRHSFKGAPWMPRCARHVMRNTEVRRLLSTRDEPIPPTLPSPRRADIDALKPAQALPARVTDAPAPAPRRNCMSGPEQVKNATDGGLKFDAGKPGVELLPFESLIEIAKVLDFGAKKYHAHNWRKGMAWSRLGGAALRHLFAWMRGENVDPETGLSHLAHLGCCVLFLLSYEQTKAGTDDRYKSHTSA